MTWWDDLQQSGALYNQALRGPTVTNNVTAQQLHGLVGSGQSVGNVTTDENGQVWLDSPVFGRQELEIDRVRDDSVQSESDSGIYQYTTLPGYRLDIGNPGGSGRASDGGIRIDDNGNVISANWRDPNRGNRWRNGVLLGMAGGAALSYANGAGAAAGSGATGSGTATGAATGGGLVNGSTSLASGTGAGIGGAEAMTVGSGSTLGDMMMSAGGAGGYFDTAGQLIGGVGGALAGYMDARNQPQTLTSTTSVDPSVMPYVQDYMQRAQAAAGGAPNAVQTEGTNMVRDLAGNSGMLNQALGANQGFMSGANVNPYQGENPYMQGMIDSSSRDIINNYQRAISPNTDANFVRGGTFGGSAWADAQRGNSEALAQQLADTSNQYRWQNYNQSAQLAENNLGRQQSAIGMAPALDNARYGGADRLLQQGNTQFGQQQTAMSNYGNAVRAGMASGGTTTSNNPNVSNPWASALGGGLAGLEIYRGLTGGR